MFLKHFKALHKTSLIFNTSFHRQADRLPLDSQEETWRDISFPKMILSLSSEYLYAILTKYR